MTRIVAGHALTAAAVTPSVRFYMAVRNGMAQAGSDASTATKLVATLALAALILAVTPVVMAAVAVRDAGRATGRAIELLAAAVRDRV